MSLWVIKIGTSILRGTNEISTSEVINKISSSIASSKDRGDQVILVTSGAVGLGCYLLGLKKRPEDIVSLQASASVGQGQLMSLYDSAMNKHGYKVAQILLTRNDLRSRASYQNASLTLKKLLEWEILPIVNENDALSSEELRYGDNDTLSALVAAAVSADQLILLTDIDRLYSSDPRTNSSAEPITDVHSLNELKELEEESNESGSWGTGGVKTKLSAARIATASGITVHLADGRKPDMLEQLLQGSRGGTVFHPNPSPIGNRKSWLAYALKPLGALHLDQGACEAIQNRGASLLLVGVKKIEGNFAANEPVKVINANGREVARGISSKSSDFLLRALRVPLTFERSPVVIHRDVLVLTGEGQGK